MRIVTAATCLMLAGSVALANEKKEFEKWEKRRDELCKPDLSTPASQFYVARLAVGKYLTVEKLQDQTTLTPEEGNLLLQRNRELQPCREVAQEGNYRWWPQRAPIDQAYNSRTEAIYIKLATQEIAVGEGVRLLVASLDQWRNEMAVVNARSAAEAEVARRAAEEAKQARLAAFLQLVKQDEAAREASRAEDARVDKLADAMRSASASASASAPAPVEAPKPKPQTTRCNFIGSQLECHTTSW